MIDPMASPPVFASQTPGAPRRDPGLVAATLLLLAGSMVALSIDVPRTLLGIKGDEAT